MILGCSPSEMYLSACLRSSPTRSTTEVVPSPHMSSWAVAARAIITAVGFCICISLNRTFPSFVSLIYEAHVRTCVEQNAELDHTPPAPSTNLEYISHELVKNGNTNILMVPKGPRFDFRTSCRPSPALMLTFKASPLL